MYTALERGVDRLPIDCLNGTGTPRKFAFPARLRRDGFRARYHPYSSYNVADAVCLTSWDGSVRRPKGEGSLPNAPVKANVPSYRQVVREFQVEVKALADGFLIPDVLPVNQACPGGTLCFVASLKCPPGMWYSSFTLGLSARKNISLHIMGVKLYFRTMAMTLSRCSRRISALGRSPLFRNSFPVPSSTPHHPMWMVRDRKIRIAEAIMASMNSYVHNGSIR